MAATQGFVIELNDMHGKPKSQKVYQEKAATTSTLTIPEPITPITSIEYSYKSDPYGKIGRAHV